MSLNEPTIGQVALFATLPPDELERLAAMLRVVTFPHGAVLFREGEYGDRFFIVLDGELEIIKALGSDNEFMLDARGPGEFVGEMSLLYRDGLRSASVRTRGATRMLEMARDDFEALLHRYPSIAYEMVRVLSNRLRDANNATIRDLREKNRQLTEAYLELKAAQARIIEQETLERELQVARSLQEAMLPRELPNMEGFDFSARMVPARTVSGDFYDFIPLDNYRVGIVIADVCGKGLPAALLMSLTRSLLRAEALRGGPPAEVLRSVNRHLLDMSDSRTFVTVLYGILHQQTREFVYVRAGHELPLIIGSDGEMNVPHMGQGQPLGILVEPDLDAQQVTLPFGGTLLLYTDGVTEAVDQLGDFFETERLYEVASSGRGLPAQVLCDSLLQAVTAHRGSAPQADDVTMVAVHVL
jgi:phosphoserine phosphatase RsbU/P